MSLTKTAMKQQRPGVMTTPKLRPPGEGEDGLDERASFCLEPDTEVVAEDEERS